MICRGCATMVRGGAIDAERGFDGRAGRRVGEAIAAGAAAPTALLALAGGAAERREDRFRFAEEQLRRRSSERGLDWERMSEDEREAFVDDLIHEDRPCGQ